MMKFRSKFEKTIATRLERNLFEQILLEKCSKLVTSSKLPQENK